jgi:hypothetical protein
MTAARIMSSRPILVLRVFQMQELFYGSQDLGNEYFKHGFPPEFWDRPLSLPTCPSFSQISCRYAQGFDA